MEPRGDSPGTATFAQALASLKRTGCNLLLVGPAYQEAHLPASRRLLGSAEAETERSRLLVVTDGTGAVERRLGDLDPSTVRTLSYDCQTRGAAAATPVEVKPADATPDVSQPDLATLCRRIESVVAEISAEGAGLAPAELRICFDSLVPLLETFDERDVFAFLHALTAATSDVGAMAHYHLPVPADDPLVRTIAPLFEAVVELRVTSRGPEQRWRLTDEDVVTEWLPI
jgi:hypothetical protein